MLESNSESFWNRRSKIIQHLLTWLLLSECAGKESTKGKNRQMDTDAQAMVHTAARHSMAMELFFPPDYTAGTRGMQGTSQGSSEDGGVGQGGGGGSNQGGGTGSDGMDGSQRGVSFTGVRFLTWQQQPRLLRA